MLRAFDRAVRETVGGVLVIIGSVFGAIADGFIEAGCWLADMDLSEDTDDDDFPDALA